ncbi:MAG: hypothetical protein IJR07_11400 [Bacteroidaceae bacterium]|nr:hypothetical protein [Bacteroidaceae bacterium]
MIKKYQKKSELEAAFKKSVNLRFVWEDAVAKNISKEEMNRRGIKSVYMVD